MLELTLIYSICLSGIRNDVDIIAVTVLKKDFVKSSQIVSVEINSSGLSVFALMGSVYLQ